ncbi:MAG TPA: transporter [Gemmatimonadales bacterium]
MTHRRRALVSGAIASVGLMVPLVCTAQILETETARPLGRGGLEVGTNFEYQTSSEGNETALPFALEYGFTDRLEVLVEPVAYTAIRPNVGAQATGMGDMEVTLTYLARRESGGTPALALAGEVKLPTARDSLIGTGKTDIAGYLIASKRMGRFDTHANVGYTVVGRPAGAQLKNIFNFALATQMRLGQSNELFGEILGNTASSSTGEPTGSVPPGGVVAEAPAGEIVGSVGIARYVMPTLRLSLGLSVDNNGAFMFRPGFTIRRH